MFPMVLPRKSSIVGANSVSSGNACSYSPCTPATSTDGKVSWIRFAATRKIDALTSTGT